MNPGDVVANRFEVERLAGTGGMGAVYRARDRLAGEPVALKVLPGGHSRDAARFVREALALAELKHPAIVRYVAHGVTPRDELYLAMEWLEGEDLLDRLTGAGLTVAETVRLVARVAEALGVVHARGIVHRDVKPTNLFLPDGDIDRVKLLDFGIARFGESKRMTNTGILLGTPGYMAPEQARAEPAIDPSADVFALGCVLYECLTGRPAFYADSLLPLLAKILLEEVPRASEVCVGVPEALDDLVARMLSKDPAGRPRDGAEVAAELVAIPLVDRSSRPPVSKAAAELTRGEQRLLSVVLVAHLGPEPPALRDQTTVPTPPSGAPSTVPSPTCVDGLRAVVEGRGGKLWVLADGSMVATLSGAGIATDLAAQAARCALAMQALVPEPPMALATGRGEVAGRLPVGEVIDRAARLLTRAGADAGSASPGPTTAAEGVRPIALDDVTAGLLDAHFDVQGTDAGLMLCGERDLAEGTRTLLGKPTACVGRDRELSTLFAIWSECVDEPVARAVLVTAAAGVGKSRLAYELLRTIRERGGGGSGGRPAPLEIWTGWGDPMSAGSAFGLLAQALRRAFGLFDGEPLAVRQKKLQVRVARHVAETDVPRVSEFLGELIGTPFPGDKSVQLRAARRDAMLMGDQMRRAFEDFLLAECSAQPVLLVLEDLHWGDLPTVTFLDAALRNLRDQPLMVLALARPEVRSLFPALWADRGLQEVHLAELTRKAAERLVRQVLGADVSREIVDRLVKQADGHAFYLEELIRAEAEGRGAALPVTVVAMVQARLESLEGEARRVLRAASVFGQTFWQGGVAALLGGAARTTRVVEWLEELAKRELISRRGTERFPGEREYAFRGELVREAAYAMLTERDRALGHRLAGAWLERVGEVDAMVLAEHYERGGELASAVLWYRRAAEQALDGNDFEQALEGAERGVRCGVAGEALGALRLLQAEAHRWRGEYAKAKARGEEAMQRLPQGSEAWYGAATEVATASGVLGDYEHFVALVSDLRALWKPGEVSRSHAMTCARAAVFALYAGRPDLVNALLDQDLASLGEAVAGDPAVMALIHQAHAARALFQGDTGTCLERYEAGVQSHEQAGDLRSACAQRVNLGYTFLEIGAYEQAESVLREALAAAERMGLHHVIPGAKQNLGLALAHRGELVEACAMESQVIEICAAQGNRRMETAARLYLARIFALAADAQSAEREAAMAVSMSEGQVSSTRAHALALLAEIRLGLGRAEEARRPASEAMGILEAMGGIEAEESRVRLVYAEAQRAAGDREVARSAITAARERLLARAGTIRDPALRASFLEGVPENARTFKLADEWTRGDVGGA